MKKEVLIDRDKMYALTQDTDGKLYIEVAIGGIAMELLVVPLSSDETSAYQVEGKWMLDQLAREICFEPSKFRCRAVQP